MSITGTNNPIIIETAFSGYTTGFTEDIWTTAVMQDLSILERTGRSETISPDAGCAARIEEDLSRIITDHPELLKQTIIGYRLNQLGIIFQELPSDPYSISQRVIRCLRYANGMDYSPPYSMAS